MDSQGPSTGPLANITDKTLDEEANANNIVKDEVVTDNENLPEELRESVIDELGLVTVPPLPSTSNELPDTKPASSTTNRQRAYGCNSSSPSRNRTCKYYKPSK